MHATYVNYNLSDTGGVTIFVAAGNPYGASCHRTRNIVSEQYRGCMEKRYYTGPCDWYGAGTGVGGKAMFFSGPRYS